VRAIDRLEKQQARRVGTVQTGAYAFRLSPTCPPSTSITFRGGLAWFPTSGIWSTGFYIPSYTVDLADPEKTSVRVSSSNYVYTFTNAHWYAPCVVGISQELWPPPDPWPDAVPDDAINLYGGIGSPYLQEFETAAEAETALGEIMAGEISAFYGVAAGGLVLRNNGNTTEYNQYQPVDLINRGRSYLFGGKRYGWELG